MRPDRYWEPPRARLWSLLARDAFAEAMQARRRSFDRRFHFQMAAFAAEEADRIVGVSETRAEEERT